MGGLVPEEGGLSCGNPRLQLASRCQPRRQHVQRCHLFRGHFVSEAGLVFGTVEVLCIGLYLHGILLDIGFKIDRYKVLAAAVFLVLWSVGFS